jgi:tRNA nucleotidyltransferase (CCA-adding enzyme)
MGRPPYRRERSAGFVCFREGSDPAGQRVWLLLNYGKHWDYPKGHVHAREDDLAAARRELLEETGLTPLEVFDGFSHEINYFFRSPRKGLVEKSVVFFLARIDGSAIRLSEEHVGYDLLPLHEALHRLTFATARELLRTAAAHAERAMLRL